MILTLSLIDFPSKLIFTSSLSLCIFVSELLIQPSLNPSLQPRTQQQGNEAPVTSSSSPAGSGATPAAATSTTGAAAGSSGGNGGNGGTQLSPVSSGMVNENVIKVQVEQMINVSDHSINTFDPLCLV